MERSLSNPLLRREKWFAYWKRKYGLVRLLGMSKENLRFEIMKLRKERIMPDATDIELRLWGWQEMMGIHNRGDWDLTHIRNIQDRH